VRQLRHFFTGDIYEWADDGIGPVAVRSAVGVEGRFDRDGQRIAGQLEWADPALCRWIVSGGPSRRRSSTEPRKERRNVDLAR
jgi:hypothetical protein